MDERNLTAEQAAELLGTLEQRFARNMHRHEGVRWEDVRAKLTKDALWTLSEMERTGGEPDVTGRDADGYVFCDCAPESPAGRRSLCYDGEALESRKENRPRGSAVGEAREMGIELLTEEQYRALQELGKFDMKTSSWIATPPEIRKLGGALFGDRRYERVFVYHNGAESYYAARGFRGCVRV